MIEVDLQLISNQPGQKELPEWSKLEKLRSLYQTYAQAKASCTLVSGTDIDVGLFTTRSGMDVEGYEQPAGYLSAEKGFQFYGVSRLKVERVDKDVTRYFALPVAGPAAISEVAGGEELSTLLEDLAQLQMVVIPRVHTYPQPGAPTDLDCFRISNVTLVPTRVFDEEADPEGSGTIRLSLDARRRLLEHVTRQSGWLDRFETEVPGCGTVDLPGFRGRQVTSLDLTVRELIPDVEFVAQTVRFWEEVESRIEKLRAEEEEWRKLLK